MHPLLTNTTGSVDEMTENYSEGLVSLIDIHAPTIRSNVTNETNNGSTFFHIVIGMKFIKYSVKLYISGHRLLLQTSIPH